MRVVSTSSVDGGMALWRSARVRDAVCLSFCGWPDSSPFGCGDYEEFERQVEAMLRRSIAPGTEANALLVTLGRDEELQGDFCRAFGAEEFSSLDLMPVAKFLVVRAMREALVVDRRFGVTAGLYLTGAGRLRVLRALLGTVDMSPLERDALLGLKVEEIDGLLPRRWPAGARKAERGRRRVDPG